MIGLDLSVPLGLFSCYTYYIVLQDSVVIMVIILPLLTPMSLIFMAQNVQKGWLATSRFIINSRPSIVLNTFGIYYFQHV